VQALQESEKIKMTNMAGRRSSIAELLAITAALLIPAIGLSCDLTWARLRLGAWPEDAGKLWLAVASFSTCAIFVWFQRICPNSRAVRWLFALILALGMLQLVLLATA